MHEVGEIDPETDMLIYLKKKVKISQPKEKRGGGCLQSFFVSCIWWEWMPKLYMLAIT